jgi:hypothetical protein
MKRLRQLIKIIMTPAELKAVCINAKGNSIALAITLKDNPEIKKLVDNFSIQLLEALEKEIG